MRKAYYKNHIMISQISAKKIGEFANALWRKNPITQIKSFSRAICAINI
jgi:hypothetical protein